MDKTPTPFFKASSPHTTKPISKKASLTKIVKKKNRKKKSVKIIHTCCIINLENEDVKGVCYQQNWANITNINKRYLEDKIEVNGLLTNQMAMEREFNSKMKQEGPTEVKVEENMQEKMQMWEQIYENMHSYEKEMEKMRYNFIYGQDYGWHYEIKK